MRGQVSTTRRSSPRPAPLHGTGRSFILRHFDLKPMVSALNSCHAKPMSKPRLYTRTLLFLGIIGLTPLVGCASVAPNQVKTSGDEANTRLVLRLIRAAETGNAQTFQRMTGRSAEATFEPPVMRDVDRTDEGCELRALDASMPKIVSAIWFCPDNTKPNVQRSFLIEDGRITHMWNEWGGGWL